MPLKYTCICVCEVTCKVMHDDSIVAVRTSKVGWSFVKPLFPCLFYCLLVSCCCLGSDSVALCVLVNANVIHLSIFLIVISVRMTVRAK